jgi:hypothetical protein
MDDGLKAGICLVGAHGDALELLELAEEVLDQVTPLVHLGVDRRLAGSAWMLSDHDLGPPFVEIGNDGVAVEGCVGDQSAEAQPLDQRRHADGVEPMAGQQDKAHEISESIGEREDLGRQTAFGTAYGWL